MGEYFSWVNTARREFIRCGDFDDYLCKLYQTVWYDCMGYQALCTMLNGEWKGQPILYLGDETHPVGDRGNPVIRQLIEEHRQWGHPGFLFDYVSECYRDITPLFCNARASLQQEIEWILRQQEPVHDPYRLDRAQPFQGLFERPLMNFRYVVNSTKREYLDRTHAQRPKTWDATPLPLLMAYVDFEGEEPFIGHWLGDALEVTDSPPPEDCRDMSEVYRVNFG